MQNSQERLLIVFVDGTRFQRTDLGTGEVKRQPAQFKRQALEKRGALARAEKLDPQNLRIYNSRAAALQRL